MALLGHFAPLPLYLVAWEWQLKGFPFICSPKNFLPRKEPVRARAQRPRSSRAQQAYTDECEESARPPALATSLPLSLAPQRLADDQVFHYAPDPSRQNDGIAFPFLGRYNSGGG
jgi:hypothetical protein